jgi:hypothetical protein
MSSTLGRDNYAELADLVTRLSYLQTIQVERLLSLRRLHSADRRAGAGLLEHLPELLDSPGGQAGIISLRRDDLIGALADPANDELLAAHQLRADSTDWPIKYSAFNAAYANAVDVHTSTGRGVLRDRPALKVLDAVEPATAIGNAIAGSAAHAIPLAGGVYKEIKDNIEGIGKFVKSLPGAIASCGRGAKKLVKSAIGRGGGSEPAAPAEPALPA